MFLNTCVFDIKYYLIPLVVRRTAELYRAALIGQPLGELRSCRMGIKEDARHHCGIQLHLFD